LYYSGGQKKLLDSISRGNREFRTPITGFYPQVVFSGAGDSTACMEALTPSSSANQCNFPISTAIKHPEKGNSVKGGFYPKLFFWGARDSTACMEAPSVKEAI